MFSGASRSVLFIALWISTELNHNLDSPKSCAISSLLHNGIWVTVKIGSGSVGVDWEKILPSSGLCRQGTCCDGVVPLCPPTKVCHCYRWFRLFRAMLPAEKSDTVSPKGLHTCCSYALRRSAAPDSQVSDPPFLSTGCVFMSFIFNCYCCCEHDDREWESAHDYVQEPKETGTGHQNPGAAGAGGCDPKWVLGFKPKSSKRAASPLKCWAIFPVPEYCLKIFGWIAVYLQTNSTVWSPPVLTLLWTPERAGRSSHSDANHWRHMGGDSGSAVQVSRKATIVPQVSQPGLGNYIHSSYTCAIVTRLFLAPHSHPKTWISELQC